MHPSTISARIRCGHACMKPPALREVTVARSTAAVAPHSECSLFGFESPCCSWCCWPDRRPGILRLLRMGQGSSSCASHIGCGGRPSGHAHLALVLGVDHRDQSGPKSTVSTLLAGGRARGVRVAFSSKSVISFFVTNLRPSARSTSPSSAALSPRSLRIGDHIGAFSSLVSDARVTRRPLQAMTRMLG